MKEKEGQQNGGLHSSVDSSAPNILRSGFKSQTSSIYIDILCYICHCVEKRTKLNKKEAEFG